MMDTLSQPGHGHAMPLQLGAVCLLVALTLSLVAIAPATDRIGPAQLSFGYLLLLAVVLNRHDTITRGGISPLFTLQVGLIFAIGTITTVLTLGGLGSRALELTALFVCTIAVLLARDDLRWFAPLGSMYVLAFATLFAIFLGHSAQYPADSGLGLFPVFSGLLLAVNLFVIPRYVSQDILYWTLSLIAAAVALVALPTAIIGEYSLGAFEVRPWGSRIGIGDLIASRSIYANPNTLGIVIFPGLIASVVAAHRTWTRAAQPGLAIIPLVCTLLSVAGLVLSNSRSAMLAAGVGIGVYGMIALMDSGPAGIPLVVPAACLGVIAFLGAIFAGVLPIDAAYRFELWLAGVFAVVGEHSITGAGIVGTGDLIEPYLPADVPGSSVHNSYLSIALRAGLVGVIAYVVLVWGPLVHAIVRPVLAERAVGMLAIATAGAIHQLFEAYTLYQFGPGSIIGALAVGYVIEGLVGRAGVPESPSSES